MEICLASECDLESIASLEKDIFKDFWSFDMIKSQFEMQNSVYIIAKSTGITAGYACFTYVCDEAELLRICVDKNFRRQGTATKIFEKAEEIFKEKSIAECFLEVRAGNESAVAFYKKNGFEILGKRKGYYTSYNNEDALVMSKKYTRES